MRDASRGDRWFCIRCGGGHPSAACPLLKRLISNAPLETPSHNGPWRGKIPVRVLPPGIMSEDRKLTLTQSQLEKPTYTHTCSVCSTPYKSKRKFSKHRYCSTACRSRDYETRRDRKRRRDAHTE